MARRLIVLIAVFGLVAMWMYPQIQTTYNSWSHENNSWATFKTVYHRGLLTNAEFGTKTEFPPYYDDILGPGLRSKTLSIPYTYGYHLRKKVGISWLTQLLGSLLVVAGAALVAWVFAER